MNEFTFKDYSYFGDNSGWLKTKDLSEGHVYILKDGRIAVYLGKTENGLYCFYICCNMHFKNVDSNRILSFANYEVQLRNVINICNDLMHCCIYKESVLLLKGLPKIYCEFPFVNYESVYKSWYLKSQISLGTLPTLCSISNKKVNNKFVGAKDLIPGNLYYSGSCWRSIYVYLGRKTSDKSFVWYFVGNEHILLSSNAYDLLNDVEITKSNKKLKPLEEALNDPNVYVSKDCENLIKMGYKVDMSVITQNMLDMVR